MAARRDAGGPGEVRLAAGVYSSAHIVEEDGGVDGERELEAVLVAGRCLGSRWSSRPYRPRRRARPLPGHTRWSRSRREGAGAQEPVLVAFDLCTAAILLLIEFGDAKCRKHPRC